MSTDKKVRVAIIGVGNCASSLVQGVQFYKNAAETDRIPGLMHVNLGGYHISDIEFTAAFDVVEPRSARTCAKPSSPTRTTPTSSAMSPTWACRSRAA